MRGICHRLPTNSGLISSRGSLTVAQSTHPSARSGRCLSSLNRGSEDQPFLSELPSRSEGSFTDERGTSQSHADLIAWCTSAPTAREYGILFTVVRFTSPQNSGLTGGLATTSGFEIEYFEAEAEAARDRGQHPIIDESALILIGAPAQAAMSRLRLNPRDVCSDRVSAPLADREGGHTILPQNSEWRSRSCARDI